MAQKILVIGSGGREHALLWKLAQSPRAGKLYAAPGNGGTRQIAENISNEASDIESLAELAEKKKIDLTVVGPDDSLAAGIVNTFQKRNLKIFGPTRIAALIESSKFIAKHLMIKAKIPTAGFNVFDQYHDAVEYILKCSMPKVIKADGLALGKGVYICRTTDEAETALKLIMVDRIHGKAGNQVIIEEFLNGQEVSIHALCDGRTSLLFPPAQDHKTVFDGDKGKNTGGMGTITPLPWISNETMENIANQIVQPTLKVLTEWGCPFTGCLYPGLMMTDSGPKVLEFNGRFGDPETQSYMRLLKTDLLDIFEACVNGTLSQIKVEWHPGFAVCIVLTSGGYPDEYKKGLPISGIETAEHLSGIVIFHAGTKFTDQLVTSGGRVLGVSATGNTLSETLDRAYEAVNVISFENMHYRHDIGAKSIKS